MHTSTRLLRCVRRCRRRWRKTNVMRRLQRRSKREMCYNSGRERKRDRGHHNASLSVKTVNVGTGYILSVPLNSSGQDISCPYNISVFICKTALSCPYKPFAVQIIFQNGYTTMSEWTPIIGLEIHAEILTESKMFSACPVVDSVTAPPNTAVDPVSLGLPGTLPVINQRALEMAMMVGLALNCEIPPINQFARKSYFYPDLPKGYQISQYDRPLCINGYLDIDLSDGTTQRIRVRRAHIEEDTGKLIHTTEGSLVDYNRAGVPLLEIVTEPDIHSAEAAEAYARKLRAILQYLGINDGDMSKGVMRIEPNISVRHKDDTGYRTRTEVKNLNSIRSLFRAIEYETERQIKAWERGEGVRQATMGWDEVKQITVVQRYKESAEEYRYFPEPDLPVVEVSREWVERVRA